MPGVGLVSVHEVRAETSWCGPAPMLVECMSSLAEQGFSFESLSVEYIHASLHFRYPPEK